MPGSFIEEKSGRLSACYHNVDHDNYDICTNSRGKQIPTSDTQHLRIHGLLRSLCVGVLMHLRGLCSLYLILLHHRQHRIVVDRVHHGSS